MELFGGAFKNMEKVLDFYALRHNLLSANIANAETPNYRAFDLVFKEQLKKVFSDKNLPLLLTDSRHISSKPKDIYEIKPVLVATSPLTLGLDGNFVDIDYQMSQLAQNTLEYQALVQMLIRKIAILRYAINEGRR